MFIKFDQEVCMDLIRITIENQMIPQKRLEIVFESFFKRMRECQLVQGRHLKDVVFKKILFFK